VTHWVRNGVIPWLVVFLGFFLALELPARDIGGVWPWPSLSQFVWNDVTWWWPVSVIVAVIMVVLFGHFEWRWPARFLIVAASLALVSIGLHVLWLALRLGK